jgi:hypothetical protein
MTTMIMRDVEAGDHLAHLGSNWPQSSASIPPAAAAAVRRQRRPPASARGWRWPFVHPTVEDHHPLQPAAPPAAGLSWPLSPVAKMP